MATTPWNGHSEGCHEAMIKAETAREAFFAEHPTACQTCDARGLVGGDLDFETGAILVDACPDCAERGKCSVCAELLTPIAEFAPIDRLTIVGYEDVRPCGHDENTLQAPPSYECLCWIDEADRALDEAQQNDAENARDQLARDAEYAQGMEEEADRYDYAADDHNYDVVRERSAFGPSRGRD